MDRDRDGAAWDQYVEDREIEAESIAQHAEAGAPELAEQAEAWRDEAIVASQDWVADHIADLPSDVKISER